MIETPHASSMIHIVEQVLNPLNGVPCRVPA
jgi:hypothetical protein